jgi:hypothetical protein
MGKINQGILGGFSGTVGSVVGASWKGINYMRSKAVSIANPRTDGQVKQRTKFSVTLAFLQPLTDFLRVGYKLYANKKTAFNAAMSYVIDNAIIGESPDFSIDPSKVMVSRGPLAPALNARATILSDNILIEWDDNSTLGNANASDKALAVVYNTTKMEVIYITAGSARTDKTQSIAIPLEWSEDDLSIYLGFISEDGSKVANSSYVTSITQP